jgi:predicted GTPase
LPAVFAVDSPGLGAGQVSLDGVIAQSQDCDLLLWVSAATRADREIDRAALTRFREHFANQPNRRRPPVLMVLTHIDRLRPFKDWSPPYDLTAAESEKARSIRSAIEAMGSELGFQDSDIVPVCLSPEVGSYNVDALWGRIIDILPEARRAQLVRRLRDKSDRMDWSRVFTQAVNAGRVIVKSVRQV